MIYYTARNRGVADHHSSNAMLKRGLKADQKISRERMAALPQDEIEDVGREIASRIAPGELILFRMYSDEFFRAPEKGFSKQSPREDTLGFGAGEVVHLATPMILAGVTEAFKILSEDFTKQLGSKVGKDVWALIRNRFRSSQEPTTPLTQQQLARVHAAALKKLGADTPRAAEVADAIVAALVLPA